MFTKGLPKQTRKNLEILEKVPFISKYYLAGGTALSLYLGHRLSFDLDFFSQNPEKPIIIVSQLKERGKLEVFQNNEGVFSGLFNKVKISFFIYPYRLIKPLKVYKNIKIASLADIACMKLDAISSRGTKRDFVDLYFICKEIFPLEKIFTFFEKKYKEIKFNKLHLLKSLAYFDDAETEAMPQMLKKASWQEIKIFFKEEAVRLAKKIF